MYVGMYVSMYVCNICMRMYVCTVCSICVYVVSIFYVRMSCNEFMYVRYVCMYVMYLCMYICNSMYVL